jgi:hypothetical protein
VDSTDTASALAGCESAGKSSAFPSGAGAVLGTCVAGAEDNSVTAAALAGWDGVGFASLHTFWRFVAAGVSAVCDDVTEMCAGMLARAMSLCDKEVSLPASTSTWFTLAT